MKNVLSRVLSVSLFVSAAGAILLACGGATPPPAPSPGTPEPAPAAQENKGPPAIPHDLVGKDDCMSCHKIGEGVKPMSESHKGRDNSTCKGCHQPKAS